MRRHTRVTGDTKIGFVLECERSFQVSEVRLHLNASSNAEDYLIISLDALAGPEYDIFFVTQDMIDVADYVWLPTRPHDFVVGDKLRINMINPEHRIYGIEIVWSWVA
jgi:hypothetical protein